MKTVTIGHIHRTNHWVKTGLYYLIWLLVLTAVFTVLWLIQNRSSAQGKKYSGAQFVYAEQWSEADADPFRDAYLPAVQSQHRI